MLLSVVGNILGVAFIMGGACADLAALESRALLSLALLNRDRNYGGTGARWTIFFLFTCLDTSFSNIRRKIEMAGFSFVPERRPPSICARALHFPSEASQFRAWGVPR